MNLTGKKDLLCKPGNPSSILGTHLKGKVKTPLFKAVLGPPNTMAQVCTHAYTHI